MPEIRGQRLVCFGASNLDRAVPWFHHSHMHLIMVPLDTVTDGHGTVVSSPP